MKHLSPILCLSPRELTLDIIRRFAYSYDPRVLSSSAYSVNQCR